MRDQKVVKMMGFTKHGQCGTRLYEVWKSMKGRCDRKTSTAYAYYGARGIKYAPEWSEFEPFYEWAIANGYDENAPFGECTLDRINNDGDYCPENCRWVNLSRQFRNKRTTRYITVDGITQSLEDWSDISGTNSGTIRTRLRHGYTAKEAVFGEQQEKKRKPVTFNGESHTLIEWSLKNGWAEATVYARLRRGWTLEKALTTPIDKGRWHTSKKEGAQL